MERLTTRHNGVAVIKDKSKHKEAMEKLAHLEDLEEQGLLLTLPCAEGTTVYKIDLNTDACYKCNYYYEGYYDCPSECENKEIVGDESCYYPTIAEKPICDKHFWEIIEFKAKLDWILRNRDSFKKKWFLDKAEAEKALAEMEK